MCFNFVNFTDFLFQISELLLELCVTELEDVTSDTESFSVSAQPVVQESPHPYPDDTSLNGTVRIAGAQDCNEIKVWEVFSSC